jgi:hypothetical protein
VSVGSAVTNPGTLAAWGMTLTADAAGVSASGLSYNGATLSSAKNTGGHIIHTSTRNTLTGLLGSGDLAFDWSGDVDLGGSPGFFPLGTYVVAHLTLVSTNGGDVVTYSSASLGIKENPIL